MDRLLSMRVFRRVIDEGGFAAAARALDLSPAVVTRLVADLEQHLGTRLLQRTTRRLSVTEAGAQYAERVKAILAEIDEAEACVSATNQDLGGSLRISAPPVLATQVLAPLISEFRALHPQVSFDLQVGQADAGTVEDHDVTLLATRTDFDSAVVARHVVTVEGILVAAPAYLERHPAPREPDDLAAHDALLWRLPGITARHWQLQRGDDAADLQEVRVQPALTSNNIEVLLQAALQGGGIASATRAIAARYLDRGDLVRVLPDWTIGRISVYAALPSRRYIPRRVQLFLDFIAARAHRR